MNYIDKKKEVMTKKDIVLAKYNNLFRESMELVVEMSSMLDTTNPSVEDQLDWIEYFGMSQEAGQIFRLAAVLQYVKNPTDQEVVSNLLTDIEVNNSNIGKNTLDHKIKRLN